jgi:hypothetical protein
MKMLKERSKFYTTAVEQNEKWEMNHQKNLQVEQSFVNFFTIFAI